MHVLYVNLWGTTAKIPEPTIIDCQSYFHQTLSRMASDAGLETQAFGDYGYVFSEALEPLVKMAAALFQAMCLVQDSDCIWPLRAAVARGLTRHHEMWLGAGTVQAAELEKSAQKGMRLLVDRRCEETLKLTRAIDVRGTSHREYNWMADGDWLNTERQTRLEAIAGHWMDEGSNYSQQMASSLLGLLRWANSTSVERS